MVLGGRPPRRPRKRHLLRTTGWIPRDRFLRRVSRASSEGIRGCASAPTPRSDVQPRITADRCPVRKENAGGFALPFSNETRSYLSGFGTHSTKNAQEKGGRFLTAGESRRMSGCTVVSGTTLDLVRPEPQQQQETARTVLLPCGAFARFR